MSEIMIAVMGATGTGKSTFINLVSGSNFQVGTGLLSQTSQVQSTKPFDLDGRKFILIDTPGFDDSTRTDSDILRTISRYLEDTYRNNRKLSGIIYMHRISDIRMSGVSRRNFSMFRKLCGDTTLGSVTLVTNMWGSISEQEGVTRENELKTNNQLFKPVLDKGAKMMRHHNTLGSGKNILKQYVGKQVVTLQIQDEIVRQGIKVENTTAGGEIEGEKKRQLEEQKRKQEEEMKKTQAALRAQQEEAERRRQAEIAAARARAEAEQARQRVAREQEAARQAAEQKRRQQEAEKVAAQARAQAEAARRKREEAQRVQAEIQRQKAAAAAEQKRLQAQVREAERCAQERSYSGGGCVIF